MELSRRSFTQRGAAILATAAIHIMILTLGLMSWSRPVVRPPADRLSVFAVPAASPPGTPAPATAEPEHKPTPQRLNDTVPIQPREQPQPIALLVSLSPTPLSTSPTVVQPPPPQAVPARITPPPAPPQPASAPGVDWESRLLAHIDRHKRYPRVIGSRRPRGTAYVFFKMNRAGAILAARIERSSGNDVLDRAALETVQRAAPLPRIPIDRPEELQLSVPVEFSTS